jgi:hypothetical protein
MVHDVHPLIRFPEPENDRRSLETAARIVLKPP